MSQLRRWSAVAGSVAALALAGCQQDQPMPTAPHFRPSLELLDGAHGTGGNQHFYFLRPLLAPPSTFPGSFDPTQSPTVEICEWDGAACVGADVASFSTTSGSGSEIIRVEPGNEQYIVNWHTDESALDPAKIYRIRVLVGSYELGHADIDPVSTGKGLKNVDTDEYVGLVDGKTLPIKFRIEEGAVPATESVTLSAGEHHTCALDGTGKAYCWGYNYYGQLGTGAATTSAPYSASSPQAVAGGLTFASVVTGGYFTCGLTPEGAAYCWGENYEGELGTGAAGAAQPAPQPVAGGHVFTALAAGWYHACGLTANGTAYCWGYNAQGQAGIGNLNAVNPTPTPIANLSFTQLSAGGFDTCGISADGKTYCWGLNQFGELGNGTASVLGSGSPFETSPQLVSGSATFVAVKAGYAQTCALTEDGAASCWGYNGYGALGRGTFTLAEPAPAPVSNAPAFAQVTVGDFHVCGLTSSGTAYCWGANVYGQLGTGNFTSSATPAAIDGLAFTSIAAGGWHTCGNLADGSVRCWGDNGLGQLGSGTSNRMAPAPTIVSGGITFATP